jgi:hypothetical protein
VYLGGRSYEEQEEEKQTDLLLWVLTTERGRHQCRLVLLI